MAFHENLSRDEVVVRGSDRSFGLVMAAAFAVLAALNAWHHGWLWPWLVTLSALLLTLGLLRPAILKPFNRVWFGLGLLLHKVINPVVMGLVFYGAVMPTGIVMRLLGKDILRLRLERHTESYWIVRQPAGPAPETMKDQF